MAKEKEKDPKPADEEKKEGAEGEAGEGGEGGEGAAPKKKLSTKLIIIIGVAAFVLLGGGVGATLYFTGVFSEKTEIHNEAKVPEIDKKHEEELKTAFFSLGDLLVNLSGEGKRPNFLKVKISLELVDEKDVPTLESLKPRIIDNFQVYLRELRIEDLRGSAGMYRLREALLLRVSEVAAPVRIRDVLFQEMLVQ